MPLPTDVAQRKEVPMARGLLDYFPDALAAVAHVSWKGNQQHNPGQELHWAREKSTDHADCIMRHLVERGSVDTDGGRHSAKLAWRALALLQLELEAGDKASADTSAPPPIEESREPRPKATPGDFTKWIERQWECEQGPRRPPQWAGYIAGPMRGHPLLNFPAFDKAETRIANIPGPIVAGQIFNPAEADRQQGIDPTTFTTDPTPEQCRSFVQRDLAALGTLRGEDDHTLYLLPGWENSTGAVSEYMVATWLQLRIRDAETLAPITKVDGRALMATLTRGLAAQAGERGLTITWDAPNT